MADFLEQLEACNDESVAESLITSQVTDAIDKELSLTGIVDALKTYLNSESQHINPLDSVALSCIPLLMPPARAGDVPANDLLDLICLHSNPRETLLALDESLNVEHPLNKTEDDTDDESTTPEKILIILRLYALCLPRIPIRRKSPSSTLLDTLPNLMDQISALTLTSSSAYELLKTFSSHVLRSFEWACQWDAPGGQEDLEILKNTLEKSLLHVVTLTVRLIDTDVAKHAFERAYPQYILPQHTHAHSHALGEHHDHDHAHPAGDAPEQHGKSYPVEAFTAWGKVKTSPPVWDSDDPTTSLSPDGLIGTLIFYVEAARNAPSSSSIDLSPSPPLPTLTDSLVSRIIAPALVASYGVNQILAFLVSDVNALGSGGLTDTGRTTLINVLSPISAMHPSPLLRHIAFRLLSTLIESLTSPPLKLSLLIELIKDCPWPQLRTAAIGILRGAVLAEIETAQAAKKDSEQSLFASPALLDALGPILFRLEPLDLFEKCASAPASQEAERKMRDDILKFADSEMPAMIAGALNFYYVLLSRDMNNLTGIRSDTRFKVFEETFLDPLRDALITWQDSSNEDIEIMMNTLLSQLCMAMERVDKEIDRVEFI